MAMRSICITLTSPFALNAFLMGHVARLSQFFRVVICINRHDSNVPIILPAGVELYHVEIRRNITPIRDLAALGRLINFYRRNNFAAVFSITPKGGLLAMLAAKFAGIPVRVHCFTGQVWANRTGFVRVLLKFTDRLLARCSTELLADSPSQREYLIAERIVARERLTVLGNGSISGVDLKRFRCDPKLRKIVREKIAIPNDGFCLLYVGRMKKDKGVQDLLAAFQILRSRHKQIYLLMVGPDEENLLADYSESWFHHISYTQEVPDYMAATDLICLPSYREGFGTVLIEAAAIGVPAVASRIYGITDAVIDGETGLLHKAGDVPGIIACIESLLSDRKRRIALGDSARKRASELFSSERVEGLFSEWLLLRIANSELGRL